MPPGDVLVDLLDPTEVAIAGVVPPSTLPAVVAYLAEPPEDDRDLRPRIELHGDYVFAVLVVPHAHGDAVTYLEVDVVVDLERIVVVRKTPAGGAPFDSGNLRLHAAGNGISAGPGMLLYNLFDEIAEKFLDIVDSYDSDIDDLEDAVNTMPAPQLRRCLSDLRHDVLHPARRWRRRATRRTRSSTTASTSAAPTATTCSRARSTSSSSTSTTS
jgi:Mg2+ and Co2+ transporter CorA